MAGHFIHVRVVGALCAQRELPAWQHWFYTCPQMPSLMAATIANEKSIDAYLMRDIISILPQLVH